MIYLLDGKETYFLAKKKEQLIQESKASPENILNLDASNRTQFNLANALQFCNTISLFDENRVVLLDQPYFLKAQSGTTKKAKKDKGEDAFSLLEAYCENPNETTELILYCFGYDADKRTKEYQLLSKHFGLTVTHLHFGELSPYELEERIKQELTNHGFQLTKEAYQELVLRVGNRISNLYLALEKLDLYGKKELNYEDITHLVSSNTEVDIWRLGNAFLSGRKEACLSAYRDLIEIERMSPQAIIPILASQLRGVYMSLKCYEEGMSEMQIKEKTGRFYPMRDIQSAGNHTSTDILKLLHELAAIDQGIKAGQLQERESFEYFLLR
ncbi:MAG: DNA polymerase III subunit delta [Solobacterium sp.]|nr:DNA polymerase III subunit delta [Solobacterium sp.]